MSGEPHPCWLRAKLLTCFATFGPVEYHPNGQIVAKVLEAMTDAGGNKQQIRCLERLTLVSVDKLTIAFGDDVNFITGVGLLRIVATGRVNFYQQAGVGKHRQRGKSQLVTPTGVELGRCGLYGL